MRSSLIQLAEARAVKVKIKTVFIFIQSLLGLKI